MTKSSLILNGFVGGGDRDGQGGELADRFLMRRSFDSKADAQRSLQRQVTGGVSGARCGMKRGRNMTLPALAARAEGREAALQSLESPAFLRFFCCLSVGGFGPTAVGRVVVGRHRALLPLASSRCKFHRLVMAGSKIFCGRAIHRATRRVESSKPVRSQGADNGSQWFEWLCMSIEESRFLIRVRFMASKRSSN